MKTGSQVPQPFPVRQPGAFVGRESESKVLDTLLEDSGPSILFLYGITGVGKSTLLHEFAHRAESHGARVLLMDCRLMEPTTRGFMAELGQLTERPVESMEDVVSALSSQDGRQFVLGLDHYETFLLMDAWFRQTLFPALPRSCRVVLASQQPPVPVWSTSPVWHGRFRPLAVEPLNPSASLQLLESAGIHREQSEPLAAVTHGNPLALKMAASAALAHESVAFPDTAIQEVMQKLTSLFLADIDDTETRDALRSTSVTRRITRSVLRALSFPEEAVFDKLQELPFVDLWRDGLRVHDAVREAMARTLRATDPERHTECRRRAWRQLRKELGSAPRADIWRYTADMLYLIENPVVREAFFPSGHQELAVEPAGPEDQSAIGGILDLHESPEAVDALQAWWEHQPRSFHVARDREGKVVAFYVMCLADELSGEVREKDAVVNAWCRHVEDNPVAAPEKILFLRRWLARETGETPSPEQAACWLDVKRTYMELRPELRRVYLTVVDLPVYAEAATQLGFQHVPEASLDLGANAYQSAVLDFGPASVDGWITRLVGDELGVEVESPVDHNRRALVIEGKEVALTPLEYKLASYLEAKAGATATRDQLLDHVWGHHPDASGSSNVVDAVVKSLRRKLGPEGELVETVRGFGYRWRQS